MVVAGDKQSDCRYLSKVQSIGFADKLDVGWNTKMFGPNTWDDEISNYPGRLQKYIWRIKIKSCLVHVMYKMPIRPTSGEWGHFDPQVQISGERLKLAGYTLVTVSIHMTFRTTDRSNVVSLNSNSFASWLNTSLDVRGCLNVGWRWEPR